MPANERIFREIMSGTKDKNIRFSELQKILIVLGFKYRIKGDHFIYYKDDIDEIINIQPVKGKAKPYQIKQIRNLIIKYKLEV